MSFIKAQQKLTQLHSSTAAGSYQPMYHLELDHPSPDVWEPERSSSVAVQRKASGPRPEGVCGRTGPQMGVVLPVCPDRRRKVYGCGDTFHSWNKRTNLFVHQSTTVRFFVDIRTREIN
jgi:hypothetical protein